MEPAIFIHRAAANRFADMHLVRANSDWKRAVVKSAFSRGALLGYYLLWNDVPVTEQEVAEAERTVAPIRWG